MVKSILALIMLSSILFLSGCVEKPLTGMDRTCENRGGVGTMYCGYDGAYFNCNDKSFWHLDGREADPKIMEEWK